MSSRYIEVQGTESVTTRTIDRLGWGVLLIWVGVAVLANVGWSISLFGVGLIVVGVQLARKYFELNVDWFRLVLGLCLTVGGVLRMLGIDWNQPPLRTWLVPSLLIAAGVAVLATIWRHRN
jgi:hypothetical protein